MRSTDVAMFEEAWKARDLKTLKDLATRVGCAFDVRGLLVLEKLGGFPFADIIVIAAQACRDPIGIVLREYGDSHAQNKTLVLAACDRAENKLTIGTVVVRRKTTIGVVWPELKPWFKEVARNADHVRAWAVVEAGDRVRFALVPLEDAPAADADVDDLRRQVIANPYDRTIRTVLADALLERDDPCGEIIRLSLELDALDALDSENRGAALRDRLAALEAQHGPTIARDVTDHVESYKLRGGFVDSITLTAPRFAKQGEALFAAQPIREVVIDPIDKRAMATLAKASALSRIRVLTIEGDVWRPRAIDFATFAAPSLIALVVRGCSFGETAFDALDAPKLTSLQLDSCPLGAVALRSMLAFAARCTSLEFGCVTMDAREPPFDGGFLDVFGAPLERLETLEVTMAPFATDRWLAKLVAHAPAVREVDIDACGAATAAALAAIPTLKALTVTTLPTDVALAKLLESRSLASLSILGNYRDEAKAEADRLARTLLAVPRDHPLRHAYVGGTSLEAQLQTRFTNE